MIQTVKYSKYLIKLKRKIVETTEAARWNIIKVKKLKQEKYEIKLSIYELNFNLNFDKIILQRNRKIARNKIKTHF